MNDHPLEQEREQVTSAGQQAAVSNQVSAPPSRFWLSRRWLVGYPCLFLALSISATHLSTSQALTSLRASMDLKLDLEDSSLLNSSDLELQKKRLVQQHFLKYGIYIPLDDIIVNVNDRVVEPYRTLLSKSCGHAELYVWVPLKFRLPILGDKIVEWCLTKN